MAIVTYPHGPLEQLASNLWLVSAPTSQQLDRKMAVVRGDDGALFVHDPLWLDDAVFARLDALGPVATLFVPSWLHDFDVERFAARYPGAQVCAPADSVRRLKLPGLVRFDPSTVPSGVTAIRPPGLKAEYVFDVRHPEGGATLLVNDALFNIPRVAGMKGLMLRLMGSSGPLHVTRLARLFLVADRDALRGWLEQQARRDDLRRLVVAHGLVIDARVGEALAAAAARL